MVQEAKELGITPGKLNIITNLLGEEVTDEYINMSIRDLMMIYTATKGKEGKAKAEKAGKSEGAGKPEGLKVLSSLNRYPKKKRHVYCLFFYLCKHFVYAFFA